MGQLCQSRPHTVGFMLVQCDVGLKLLHAPAAELCPTEVCGATWQADQWLGRKEKGMPT